MIKDGNIVCDETGIILEDKVSLYPKYISIEEGVAYENNNDGSVSQKYRPGVPKIGVIKESLIKVDPKLNGKHFISMQALYDYTQKFDKQNKKV